MNKENCNREVQVVFASDSNYVMPMTAAICSIALNCATNRHLIVNIIQNGIDEEHRRIVERSLMKTGFPSFEVNWLPAPVERLTKFEIKNKWLTSMTLVRLLLPDILPSDINRAIYLDCDIIVDDDISILWDMEIGGKSILAARDTIGWVSNPDGGLSNYRTLGIPEDNGYFNAGVMYVNVKKWREDGTSEKLMAYMAANQEIIRYEDQEVLNAVLFNDWGELDFRWNWQIVWRGVRIGTHKAAWHPDRSRKSIIHYITNEKPWKPGCDYEERSLYFKYLDKTEWTGWRVPWQREARYRIVRPFGDARNALGRLRRKLV